MQIVRKVRPLSCKGYAIAMPKKVMELLDITKEDSIMYTLNKDNEIVIKKAEREENQNES